MWPGLLSAISVRHVGLMYTMVVKVLRLDTVAAHEVTIKMELAEVIANALFHKKGSDSTFGVSCSGTGAGTSACLVWANWGTVLLLCIG